MKAGNVWLPWIIALDFYLLFLSPWFEFLISAACLYLLCLRLVLDFDLLVYAFGQFPLVVCTWICMFVSVLLVPYSLFHLWSQSQSGSHSHPKLYSLLFGSAFLLYQTLGLGFLPAYVVVTNNVPPASCFIVILEQVDNQQNWRSALALFCSTSSTLVKVAIFFNGCHGSLFIHLLSNYRYA